MTTTRFFNNSASKPQDQERQYDGDIVEMISALARCAIEYTTVAGRIADFAEMLLGLVDDPDMKSTKHTSVHIT